MEKQKRVFFRIEDGDDVDEIIDQVFKELGLDDEEDDDEGGQPSPKADDSDS